MLLRLLSAVALAATLAAPSAEDDRGRPVILMIHGRGLLDRDTAELRKLWLNGLTSGGKLITQQPVVADRDVRLVWYADVLAPASSETCDYSASDPRARRDAATDPNLKSFVSLVGNIFGLLTTVVSDTESASQIRTLAADASFLSDSHKRCASERRLADALDRAKREGRPVILVAHSLGSLVAYDYLSTRRDTGVVQSLVSVGSMLGSSELRRLLIGGDSSDPFDLPPSVKTWINVRNDGDGLATFLPFGRDISTTAPRDESDHHEMIAYLRNEATTGAVLKAWCAAFTAQRPPGCATVER
jgi:pimeloyl-ACP methyl ester carboxylesterase